ncbi:MAG: protein TolR [Desulfobacterales bacterium]|jgi:biopolymer transport protein TolR|nr:protein TolR [Desulfobacteraceae bacterium]MBT4365281.1 protein TolR [Desulfobacteraceae bacterium]MBT7085055.1 protein TolR [Desulfobacterales bacterium]MBT7696784.1 protein TolR [Desulfobacterales bacterium]
MMIGGNNDFMSDINVTPFVDVMLVLLIIFMVTAPMMMQGENVSLPEAASGPMTIDDEQLIVSIDKNNKVFINDMQVTLDFLQDKMSKILEGRKSREVFLRADKNIPYGVVVRVMSEIRGAGVEKLGMLTGPMETKGSVKKK